MSSVLVAMFDTQQSAAQAREKLLSAGFSTDSVTMTGGESTALSSSVSPSSVDSTHGEHKGAIARFFDNMFGNDDAESTRSGYTETYNEAFRRGSYGVTVTSANDTEMADAEAILNECGAVDIDEKAKSWRSEGWAGISEGSVAASTTGPTSPTSPTTAALLDTGATRKLQEVEEELKVGKRAVSRGGVRVFTRVTEVPVSETVRLREERASVQRVAVDRPATEADLAMAFKEGSIEVREMDEEAVVSKTARVTGEVEIGTVATEREESVRDTVRQTKVEVEEVAGSTRTNTLRADGLSMAEDGNGRDPLAGAPGARPVGTT